MASTDIEFSTFAPSGLPLLVRPARGDGRMSLDAAVEGLSKERATLLDKLHSHGALLFRNFPITDADDFSRLVRVFGDQALDYVGGAVPRSRIKGDVFNATELTRLYKIRMHNELAYQRDYPALLFFYCHAAAREGGETTIADCRKIYADLLPAVRDRFLEKGLRYLRTFQDRRAWRELVKRCLVLYQHMTWQAAFRADTAEQVEQKCRERGMQFRWHRNGDLVVSNVFPAAITHPHTGDLSWFNQVVIQHFNRRNYGRLVYLFRSLLYRDRSTLPNQVYFSDGSPIPDADIHHIMDVTDRHTVAFPWQAGDVMLIDNRLVAHGRNPYRGPRQVYVAMLNDPPSVRA